MCGDLKKKCIYPSAQGQLICIIPMCEDNELRLGAWLGHDACIKGFLATSCLYHCLVAMLNNLGMFQYIGDII